MIYKYLLILLIIVIFHSLILSFDIHSNNTGLVSSVKKETATEHGSRSDSEENRSPTAIAVSVVSLSIAIIAILISSLSFLHSKKVARREAAQAIFKEWWGNKLGKKRKYFYSKFLPTYRKELIGRSVKEIEYIISEDNGNMKALCFFFDKVGWLGAAGLIDVDYVLGPMQHTMRRVWWTMEALIKEERKKDSTTNAGNYLDPVFQFGFEWLYKRSEQSKKRHQAYLLKSRFRNPSILRTNKAIKALKGRIDAEDQNFKNYLNNILN